LVLVGPQLCGNVPGVAAQPSPFERDLRLVLNEVVNRPAVTPFIAQAISQKVGQPPDWDRLATDPIGRANALFALPASDQSDVLVAPFSSAETLRLLAQRVASDEAYPMHRALAAVTVPMMLVLGANDQIVNNAFTLAAVKRWARSATIAVLSASGHYIQDLQYPYFRLALREFLQSHRSPAGSARLSVESWETRH
jgi:pimeloyl-ACP methyl ester carboxylesterase